MNVTVIKVGLVGLVIFSHLSIYLKVILTDVFTFFLDISLKRTLVRVSLVLSAIKVEQPVFRGISVFENLLPTGSNHFIDCSWFQQIRSQTNPLYASLFSTPHSDSNTTGVFPGSISSRSSFRLTFSSKVSTGFILTVTTVFY